MSTGGKGSRPRPYSVTQKTFESNWDAIFGKQDKQEVTEKGADEGDTQEASSHSSSVGRATD